MSKPLTYITAVWDADPAVAKAQAFEYCRQAVFLGMKPVCPKRELEDLYDENSPAMCQAKLEHKRELRRRCLAILVCGDARNEEVQDDIEYAKRYNKAITSLEGVLAVQGKRKVI